MNDDERIKSKDLYLHPFNFWRVNYGNRICSCGERDTSPIHVEALAVEEVTQND